MKLHHILNLIHSLIYYCDLHERHLIPLELVGVWLCSLLKRDEESVFPHFFFFFWLKTQIHPLAFYLLLVCLWNLLVSRGMLGKRAIVIYKPILTRKCCYSCSHIGQSICATTEQ